MKKTCHHIAVYLHNVNLLSWLQYGIITELEKNFHITILISKELKNKISKESKIVNPVFIEDGKNEWIFTRLYESKLVTDKAKSISFKYRMNRFFTGNLIFNKKNCLNHPSLLYFKTKSALNFAIKNPYLVFFHLRLFRVIFLKIFKSRMNVISSEYFIARNFDLVIIPSAGIENKVNKMIVSCEFLNTKTLVAIENWDNLTSKGLLLKSPTYISVMGDLCKGHVSELYDIPRNNILVNGLPRFENYFDLPPRKQRSTKIKIMYLGFSIPHNEISLINELLPKLNQLLGESSFDLIYKPHPAAQKRFFDGEIQKFENLSVKGSPVGLNFALPIISSNYIEELMEADLVITTPTTMALESMILKIPTIIDGTFDGIHKTSSGFALTKYTHLLDLHRLCSDNVATSVDRIVEMCYEVIHENFKPINPNINELLKLNNPYSKGLSEFILTKLR